MSRAARLVGLSVRWLREGDLPSARIAAREAAGAAVDEDLVGTVVFATACRLNRTLGELVAAVAVVDAEPVEDRAQLYLFEQVASR